MRELDFKENLAVRGIRQREDGLSAIVRRDHAFLIQYVLRIENLRQSPAVASQLEFAQLRSVDGKLKSGAKSEFVVSDAHEVFGTRVDDGLALERLGEEQVGLREKGVDFGTVGYARIEDGGSAVNRGDVKVAVLRARHLELSKLFLSADDAEAREGANRTPRVDSLFSLRRDGGRLETQRRDGDALSETNLNDLTLKAPLRFGGGNFTRAERFIRYPV